MTGKKQHKEEKNETAVNHEDKLAEITDLLKRTQASFENYKKQTETRVKEMSKFAAKDIILQILPIIDNFELALKSCDRDKNQHDFCEGVELIYSQLKTLLEENDVETIEAKGKFDPYFHEALMKVESELAENTIVEEFQKGYVMHGKVIRHAKVKISAGKGSDDVKNKGDDKKMKNLSDGSECDDN